MIRINQLDAKTISLQQDNGSVWTADANFRSKTVNNIDVIVQSDIRDQVFTNPYTEVYVNGVVLGSAQQAVIELNKFIGSFKSGGSSGSLAVADDNFFDTAADRDTYFSNNPNKLVVGVNVVVNGVLQQWNGSEWKDMTAIVRGEKGQDGKSAFQIASENGYAGTEQEFNALLSNLTPPMPDADGKIYGIKDEVWQEIVGGGSYTFDTTPTENSENPVTSDGVYKSIKSVSDNVNILIETTNSQGTRISTLETDLQDFVTESEVEQSISEATSVLATKNELSSYVEKTDIVVDSQPIENSTNLVQSGGIYSKNAQQDSALVDHVENDKGYWSKLQEVDNKVISLGALLVQLQNSNNDLKKRVSILEDTPTIVDPVYDMTNGKVLHTPPLIGLLNIEILGVDLIGSGWIAPNNGLIVVDNASIIGLLTPTWIAVNGVKADPSGTVILQLIGGTDSAQISINAGDIITQSGMGNITFYNEIVNYA